MTPTTIPNRSPGNAVPTPVFIKATMTIITTGIIGISAFLWQLNATISVLEEKDREKTEKIETIQVGLDRLQLLQQDCKESNIRTNAQLENIMQILNDRFNMPGSSVKKTN